MPSRFQLHKQVPWTGGLNTMEDPGFTDSNDLVIADNVQFTNTGARIKREGFSYFDTAIPDPNARSSSGTTRTLYFTSGSNTIVTGTDTIFVPGERVNVVATGSGNDGTYAATDVPITSVNVVSGGHTITYTDTGSLTESETATSTITVTRASSLIDLRDYWRLNSSNVKEQLLISATDDFQLFKYDSDGERLQIIGDKEVTTILCAAASTLTTGDYFTINTANDGIGYYVWFNKDSGGGDPAIVGRTAVPVAVAAADTDAQVATALQTALDALAGFVATVNTATVTVTNADAGITTDAADVNTGFTITVTTQGATNPPLACTQLVSHVINNRYILAFNAVGQKPIKYHPETASTYQLLGGTPPDFSIMCEYLGRLFTNDKTNPDRLHYSETGNPEVWNGSGDSGAIDVVTGDGDKSGITAIFPYKGFLVVQKQDKYYRLLGDSPEFFQIQPVTNAIGCVGQKSVASMDTDDGAIFVSTRGVHSIAATDAYGDVGRTFLSTKIHTTFVEGFNRARLNYIQSAYIPTLNSVVFGVTQDGETINNDLYLYNTVIKEWYRWPDISCTAVSRRDANGTLKLITGTSQGRVIQAQNGDFEDYSGPTFYRIKSPTIYPEGDPNSVKAFGRLYLFLKPVSQFSITIKCKIDNLPAQSFLLSEGTTGDLLGSTFILGTSILGSAQVTAPYSIPLTGIGRGLSIEVTNGGSAEQVVIYGFMLEYEPVDIIPEVISG